MNFTAHTCQKFDLDPLLCHGRDFPHVYFPLAHWASGLIICTSLDHSALALIWIFWCSTIHESYFENVYLFQSLI